MLSTNNLKNECYDVDEDLKNECYVVDEQSKE